MHHLNQYFPTPYDTIRLWVSKTDSNIPYLKERSSWGGHDKEDGDFISFEFRSSMGWRLDRLGYTRVKE